MEFYSPGKLLISGEYAVLHGAKALALPTKLGQSLSVESSDKDVQWVAIDRNNHVWFNSDFSSESLDILETSSMKEAQTLRKLLSFCFEMNPSLNLGLKFTTRLEFDRSWGLGSSSTLISNLAKWGGVDPYELMKCHFEGSGFDVAVSMQNHSLLYWLKEGDQPVYQKTKWLPNFKDNLLFIYLGEKQDSQKEVANNKELNPSKELVHRISQLSEEILSCDSLDAFNRCIIEHEELISNYLGRKTIKEARFSDYSGNIKSLGAWGGDFVLATGSSEQLEFFRKKGFDVIFSFDEMILT
jgi:mevalonate kinase